MTSTISVCDERFERLNGLFLFCVSFFLKEISPSKKSGSFDQGSESFVSLSKTNQLVEVHIGATESNQFPQCGNAVEYDGLIVDAF